MELVLEEVDEEALGWRLQAALVRALAHLRASPGSSEAWAPKRPAREVAHPRRATPIRSFELVSQKRSVVTTGAPDGSSAPKHVVRGKTDADRVIEVLVKK